MKLRIIVSILMLSVLISSAAMCSTSIEDEATPIEQGDMETIGQINGDTTFEDDATPIEQEDMKTIDQINNGTEF